MLTNSCETLAGVGPAIAGKLAKCGIHTIKDLLFYLPHRYQDRTRVTAIRDLRANEWCVINASVCKTEITQHKRRMFYCFVEDKTGMLRLRFFHFNQDQIKRLTNGSKILVFGEVRQLASHFEMIHPEYQMIPEDGKCLVEETLTPIYPATKGLSQTRIRQLIRQVLNTHQKEIQKLEWMSVKICSDLGFIPMAEALTLIHEPSPDIAVSTILNGTHPAIKRLAFDELLAQRISLQLARTKTRNKKAPVLPFKQNMHARFLKLLPFTLTSAQQRVSQEVIYDLQANTPMLRLVQGDVGAGKTVIAALAALQAIANGYQVALMAPTDILSEQHAQTLSFWLTQLGIEVRRLSGKMKKNERKNTLAALISHECQLLIGTHALFQEEVVFSRLGLVIIDEQHRFGVQQRIKLQQKGQTNTCSPHQLLMTATPIPRSLSMTQLAHLDISLLDELPPGRTSVITAVLNQSKRLSVIERLQKAISAGRQVYWVCTLIEESEKLQCMAAMETAKLLQEQLPKVKVGLIHGRMKAAEKERTMFAFKQGNIDLLVATTVIEVGVDVANASLMIIENAERLGLSQLHQLRGRVGRGSQQAHCLLLYQSPLSAIGRERLKIMRETCDGFIIAEKDLALRGAGEVLGTKQTGYAAYKVANLLRDQDLLPKVASLSQDLLAKTPSKAKQITSLWFGDFEHYLQG